MRALAIFSYVAGTVGVETATILLTMLKNSKNVESAWVVKVSEGFTVEKVVSLLPSNVALSTADVEASLDELATPT